MLDADISRFFDCIDRDRLGQLLERRIGDRRVLRLIRKWLNAGVMEAGLLTDTGDMIVVRYADDFVLGFQ